VVTHEVLARARNERRKTGDKLLGGEQQGHGSVSPAAAREQLAGCADLATLDRWLPQALTAVSAEALVSEPSR
jgi:hypothetical protein